MRAERRLGQMLQEQKASGGMNKGGWAESCSSNEEPQVSQPKLSDMGISKKLSSRAQKMAAIPEEEYEGTHKKTPTSLS